MYIGLFSKLHNFVSSHFTANNMAIVGLGIEHDHLMAFAKKCVGRSGTGAPTEQAIYYGG